MRQHLLPEFLIKLADMYGFFFCFYRLFLLPMIWPYRLQNPPGTRGRAPTRGRSRGLFPINGFQYHYAAAIMPLVYLRFCDPSID